MLNVQLATRDFRRTTLRPRHRPVVRAFAEALFAGDETVPPGRLDLFVDEVDAFVSPASKTLRFGLLAMLDLIRWLPLLVVGRAASFDDLPLALRVRMLERMESSRAAAILLPFVAYKTLLSMIWFEDETELTSLGYPGPERHRYKSLPMAPARESASP